MTAAVAAIIGFLVGLLCEFIPVLAGGSPLPRGLGAVVIALCPSVLLPEYFDWFPHGVPAFINAVLYAAVTFGLSKLPWRQKQPRAESDYRTGVHM